LLGVGQTVALSLAVNDGLGRSAPIRDESQASNLQKVKKPSIKLTWKYMSIQLIEIDLE
jgi:hypothetical protein